MEPNLVEATLGVAARLEAGELKPTRPTDPNRGARGRLPVLSRLT